MNIDIALKRSGLKSNFYRPILTLSSNIKLLQTLVKYYKISENVFRFTIEDLQESPASADFIVTNYLGLSEVIISYSCDKPRGFRVEYKDVDNGILGEFIAFKAYSVILFLKILEEHFGYNEQTMMFDNNAFMEEMQVEAYTLPFSPAVS